jgi:hypothetical protein
VARAADKEAAGRRPPFVRRSSSSRIVPCHPPFRQTSNSKAALPFRIWNAQAPPTFRDRYVHAPPIP